VIQIGFDMGTTSGYRMSIEEIENLNQYIEHEDLNGQSYPDKFFVLDFNIVVQ
jgi:hypothetical protein